MKKNVILSLSKDLLLQAFRHLSPAAAASRALSKVEGVVEGSVQPACIPPRSQVAEPVPPHVPKSAAFPLVPKLHLGTHLSAQLCCPRPPTFPNPQTSVILNNPHIERVRHPERSVAKSKDLPRQTKWPSLKRSETLLPEIPLFSV